MKNKNVIRKERNENNLQLFVRSIPKSIIEDKNLSGNALRLILSILGDNDETFNLSETTYCNRLNWSVTTFYRAIEDLIKCGYIKRTEIGKDKSIPRVKKAGSNKKVYFYTVSEFANLTSKEEKPSIEIEKQEEVITYALIANKFNEVIKTLDYFIDINLLTSYLQNSYNENKIISLEQLTKENIVKVLNKFKIEEVLPTSVSDKRIKEMLDERSNGLTQQAYKAVLAKIINRVKDNPSMTENEIAGKILAFKTEFRKQPVGNQD